MRMLMHIKIPHKEFNAALRDGSAGKNIQRMLEATQPQAVYSRIATASAERTDR